jgi:hypothetical protein
LRIKVTLDPDVEWLLREAMREKSISFQEALKEAARAGFRKPGQGEARRLAPGLRGLWAFLEHAHNGLAAACALLLNRGQRTRFGLCAFIEPRTTDALRPVRFYGTRAQRTRFGLCAFMEHAHIASACVRY